MRFRHMERMNTLLSRRAALAALFAALTLPALAEAHGGPRALIMGQAGAAQAATLPWVSVTGSERAAALAEANAALNSVTRLQGRFTQYSPGGGAAGGAFYMQRPGKLRFEYDPPATSLIVSDGSVVSLRDTALRTTDRTPLTSTPLNFILKSNIDLARDARIVNVARQGPDLLITARDRAGQMDGYITMRLAGPERQLASWEIVDATGARTRIVLSGLIRPAAIDRSLFRLPDIIDSRRHGPK